MKITAAKIYISSPGRNFVTIKIYTDKGISGLGDATLNGSEKAVITYFEEYISPCLIGKNPFQIEDIWQYLYRGAYWRGGPVTMTAIAAVDMALWEIKGKALNTPVYNLLGGKSRDGVMSYFHAAGKDIEETVDAVGTCIDLVNKVFPHTYYLKNSYFYLDESPGLGVDYDDKLASKYSYEKAYLPVNRKLDGTMHNW